MYTPYVAATGFSMHEIEICDFVIECREKRIAAKKENGRKILRYTERILVCI